MDYLVSDRELLFEVAELKSQNTVAVLKVLRVLFLLCFRSCRLLGEVHHWMFFNTVARTDHAYFFSIVREQCSYDKGDLILKKVFTINFRNILNVFRCIKLFPRLKYIEIPKESMNDENLKYIPLNFFERVILYLYLVRNMDLKRAVSEYNWSGVKTLVTLYDIGRPEHLAVLAANKNGINTVVLSHGIMFSWFDYKDPNTFNLYRIPSQYFLALGSDIKELAPMFGSDPEVIVCGQPKIEEEPYNPDEDVIAIASDTRFYHKANAEMIRIAETYAKQHSKHLLVRLHPTDKPSAYSVDEGITTFTGDIGNASVIIGCTTSMIFTYMSQGKRVLRYNDGRPYHAMPSTVVFSSLSEFEERMQHIREIDFRAIAKPHIDCIGDVSKQKYKEAFDYLNGKINKD